MNEPRLFRAHPRYRLLLAASALLALLLAWSLGRGFAPGQSALDQADWGNLFFLLISLAAAVWYARAAVSRVELTPSGVTLHVRFGPLARSQHVDFRQIIGVSESGRLGANLALLYHPLNERGLVDSEAVRSLALPGVVDQERLLEAIAQRVSP